MDERNFFKQYLSSLLNSKMSNNEKLFAILTARGFLLENINEGIYISDNSHIDDANYLDQWVRGKDLGRIKNNRLEFRGPVDIDDFIDMFGSQRRGGEALNRAYWSSWNYFRSRRHGFKVPVNYLEPGIAYLVKAVSAAGMLTYTACDGHLDKYASIGFCGQFNSDFFRLILHDYVNQQLNLSCKWEIINSNHVLRINAVHNDYLFLYREIFEVADLIYQNRIELRQLKQRIINQIEENADKG